ncbi:MAG: DnaJ domain-containing protein [Bacteroidia bacterium]
MTNLYHILGLEIGANDIEIKRAFRKLAKQYHPDVNPSDDAKQKFEQVYAAYDILSDPDKRKFYDPMLQNNDDDSYLDDWRSEAREWAHDFAEMSYDDFRQQQILVHMWFTNPRAEFLMALGVLFLGLFGLTIFIFGIIQFNEKRAAFMIVSTGFLFAFGGIYMFVSYILVTLNNLKIKAEERLDD